MQSIGKHIEASPPLNELIRHFYCIETPADFVATTQHLAPNLEMMLLFNFGVPLQISFSDHTNVSQTVTELGVVGPVRKMLRYEVLPGTDLIVVVFNPNGFYRLFQIPVDGLSTETVHHPDSLVHSGGFLDLWNILKGLKSTEARIQLLTEYGTMFAREADEQTTPLLYGFANNTISEPSKAIAIDTDLSERTVQLRFKKYLGFSTKEHARFLRFKQVIDFIQIQENEVDWLAIVDQFGYYDQSHLIKDFKHFLDTSPKVFVQDFLGKSFCVTRPAKM